MQKFQSRYKQKSLFEIRYFDKREVFHNIEQEFPRFYECNRIKTETCWANDEKWTDYSMTIVTEWKQTL